MREKYRKSIASLNKFPQFTTMNVIDGQAGLISYASLIFYSLTIGNILNIIVLLILAGVSIATLTGENGILTQASDAKTETTIGEEKEAIRVAYNGAMIESKGKGVTAEKLNSQFSENGTKATASGTDTIKIEFETGRSYTIDVNGKIEDYINIAEYVSVGDYVDYEPTKTDVNKTQAVDSTKLRYTSPTGTIPTDSTGTITHGNGYTSTEEATEDRLAGVQTFTVKANDGSDTGLKWRVLSVSDDKVELISDTVVQTDAAANFILKGGIGYLYAEQELNEVCKIYGYGYGADTSIKTPYTVGGPEDAPVTGTITGSGARSITIEDLNKIAGITEADYTTLNPSYGTTTNPTTAVYYPTLSSSNTTYPGQSTSTKTGFKYTLYSWDKSKITSTNTKSMLFNGNYWLASRCINTNSSSAYLCVRYVYGSNTSAFNSCFGYSYNLTQNTHDWYAVRPVVTLKSNVIDINTNYDAEGEWKLK